MKFEVKKNKNKEEYEELMYVLYNVKKVSKKPHKKVKTFTRYATTLLILNFLFIVYLVVVAAFIRSTSVDYIYFGAAVLLFIIIFVLFINGKNRIKKYQETSEDAIVNVDKNKIEITTNTTCYSVSWDEVKVMVANHYAICIICNDASGLIIALPIESYDNFERAVRKYNKHKLLIDNRALYK